MDDDEYGEQQDDYQDNQNDVHYEDNQNQLRRPSQASKWKDPIESQSDISQNKHYFENDPSPQLGKRNKYNTQNGNARRFDDDAEQKDVNVDAPPTRTKKLKDG